MTSILNICSPIRNMNSALTQYDPVGGGNHVSAATTEANVQQTMHLAGTYSFLDVNVGTNTLNGTTTVRFRKNTANGNQVISITTTSTGEFTDSSNTDAVVNTDVINYSTVSGGSSGTIGIAFISTQFAASTNTVKRLCASSGAGQSISTASTTFYQRLDNVMTGIQTTESLEQYSFKTAGTCQNGYFNVTANARTNTSTVHFRKNTANGNMTMSIGSGTTGAFEDTSNTDSIAVNDIANWSIALGTTTNTLTLSIAACDFVTTDGSSMYFDGNVTISQNISLTENEALEGASNTVASESTTQITSNLTSTYSNLEINIILNTVTATSNCNFRKNGANGNQSVSITASTTGLFTDGVNTDTTITTDKLNTQLVTGGTGTSLSWRYIGTKIQNATTTVDRWFVLTPNPVIVIQNQFFYQSLALTFIVTTQVSANLVVSDTFAHFYNQYEVVNY